jgi:putative ATPase
MNPIESNHKAPLAEAMRPKSFSDLFGQDHIFAKGFSRLTKPGRSFSIILWGPPGTGKTSLAHIISQQQSVIWLSAVKNGVADIRKQISRSEIRVDHGEAALTMFMDEIHRLNKAQQDILLPALEKGTISFIGATTENPSFEVNQAILSRSLVFALKPLEQSHTKAVLEAALRNPSSPIYRREASNEALDIIAKSAAGDARSALNLLDAAFAGLDTDKRLEQEHLDQLIDVLVRKYDKKGENHYDVISAFIKSIRASKVDAALYYLARMIDANEDPMFIARRLVIAASEDIGNANPTALVIATNGATAVQMTGYPEARIILSQITTYLCSSPKSNRSYLAIQKALDTVKKTGALPVPLHLRNAPSKLMKELGYGKDYVYAHDDPLKAAQQNYFPNNLPSFRFYEPAEIGLEKQLKENLSRFN